MKSKRLFLATGGAFLLSLAAWKSTNSVKKEVFDSKTKGPEEELLGTDWMTLDGKLLNLSSYKGVPFIVNFWATWCGPCVRELPMLDKFYKDNGSKIPVVALALDEQPKVYRFLQQYPISIPVGMIGLDRMYLIQSLGNPSGGLPFSLLFNSQGVLVDKKLGSLTEELLENWKSKTVKVDNFQ